MTWMKTDFRLGMYAKESLFEFNDILLVQEERQIWVWGMRLSSAKIWMGQGKQLFWHFQFEINGELIEVRSWRGKETFRDPLQTAKNIEN